MENSNKNSGPHKRLKDLLDKSGKENDDFEKEALEGFAMLGNEEEILKTKQDLDNRAYSELFGREKNKRNYWMAAAAVVILMGVSIYLVQSGLFQPRKDLAIVEPTQKQTTPPPPAIKEIAPEQQTESRSTVTEQPKKTREKTRSREDAATMGAGAGAVADQGLAMAEPSEEAEAKSGQELVTAPVIEKKEEEKDKTAVAFQAGNVQTLEKSKKASAPVMAAPREAAVSENKERNESVASADYAESETAFDDRGASSGSKKASNNCFYEGGEKELQKDVANLLGSKDLLHRFDVRLFVDSSGKVQKVEFIRSASLNENQKTEVIESLKKLNKFKFHNTQGNAVPAEYRLDFRP